MAGDGTEATPYSRDSLYVAIACHVWVLPALQVGSRL